MSADAPVAARFWNARGVFVTGGTGLIGSWVVKRLLGSGARVVLLVKDASPDCELVRSGDIGRCTVVYGRLEDYADIAGAINVHETETVLHLGAQTLVGAAHRDPLATLETNVRGTWNVLEACRAHRAIVGRIVVASSDKAYGDKDVLPYTEEMSLDARNTYDVSKSCTDLVSQAYANTYSLPVAVTRFGNVYGGGDLNLSRIVPGTIRALHFGERPAVRSDGTLTRDYLYVEDVAAGYLRLAEALDDRALHGQAFNFSGDAHLSVLEMVERIGALMGLRSREARDPQRGAGRDPAPEPQRREGPSPARLEDADRSRRGPRAHHRVVSIPPRRSRPRGPGKGREPRLTGSLDGCVLVTGATGFIGSHLARRLVVDGLDVHVLHRAGADLSRLADIRDSLTFWPGDLRDRERIEDVVARVAPQHAFHLANATELRFLDPRLERVRESVENNLLGGINLLVALSRVGSVRSAVRTGTLEEYGQGVAPFAEDQREAPVTPYSASQVALTHYWQMLQHPLPFSVATLRLALTYGPGQSERFFLPSLIRHCREGRDFDLTSGEQRRDLIFVTDVVEAMIRAAASPRIAGKILNVGTGRSHRVVDVARQVIELCNARIQLRVGAAGRRSFEIADFLGEVSRARELLGWEAAIDLATGLRMTIGT
jgi:CDP-glucose 4,6-dehydratase